MPATSKESTTIIIQNNTSSAAGTASFIFGLLSIFFLAPLFVPLAVLLGIVAVFNKQLGWGILGLICAFIGFLTSPILLGMFTVATVATIASHTSTISPSSNTQYQSQRASQGQQLLGTRIKQAEEEATTAVMECKNKRLTGEYRTYVTSANCSNPKIIETYRNAGYPYMDLIEQLTAKSLQQAEEVDDGRITEEGAKQQIAQFVTYLSEIEKQRNTSQ